MMISSLPIPEIPIPKVEVKYSTFNGLCKCGHLFKEHNQFSLCPYERCIHCPCTWFDHVKCEKLREGIPKFVLNADSEKIKNKSALYKITIGDIFYIGVSRCLTARRMSHQATIRKFLKDEDARPRGSLIGITNYIIENNVFVGTMELLKECPWGDFLTIENKAFKQYKKLPGFINYLTTSYC